MEEELSPCPFCGSTKAFFTHKDDDSWSKTVEMECQGCNMMLWDSFDWKPYSLGTPSRSWQEFCNDNKAEMIKIWNNRYVAN